MTRWKCFFAAGLLLPLLAGCSEQGEEFQARACTDDAGAFAASTGQGTVRTKWLYQLQNAVPGTLAASGFDILTIDYSLDGTEGGAYTAAEIGGIRAAGKTVLAYLSIGEAEIYRSYFEPAWVAPGESGLDVPGAAAPCWLGPTNPEWLGNFKVQYWSEAWQQILLAYLDRIVDAGFDGVYLDIIDGFYYWSEPNGVGLQLEEGDAAVRMMNLVRRIALHARATRGRPDFLVFPQNGEGILAYDTDGGLLGTLSGFGIEDLFYDETVAMPPAEISARTAHLGAALAAGKQVLLVDYVDDGSGQNGANGARIADFRTRALDAGYTPYVSTTDRELNSANEIPGIQP